MDLQVITGAQFSFYLSLERLQQNVSNRWKLCYELWMRA